MSGRACGQSADGARPSNADARSTATRLRRERIAVIEAKRQQLAQYMGDQAEHVQLLDVELVRLRGEA